MNLNPLQITSSLISTQFHLETHSWLFFLVNKQKNDTP